MSPQELKADNYNGLSRRNWLRKAVRAATGAMLLLFVLAGCTKEHWDMVKNPKPGGGLGSTPDQWYQLQVTFLHPNQYYEEVRWTGYLRGVTSEYIFIVTDERDGSRYKLHPAGDGWAYLETGNGSWLGITYNGWLYNYYDSTNRVAWKIVDGKLYNNYWSKDNWKQYPAGSQYSGGYYGLGSGYFAGVGFDEKHTLTNCELIPVP